MGALGACEGGCEQLVGRPGGMELEARKCQLRRAQDKKKDLVSRMCGLAPKMVGTPLKLFRLKLKIPWRQTEIWENIFMSLGGKEGFLKQDAQSKYHKEQNKFDVKSVKIMFHQ